jgi:hypothetical protein
MADAYTASKLTHEPCGADCDTKLHRPRTTGEALVCMEKKLRELYARGDRRAIFLRAYYVMTAQVNAAIHGGNEDFKTPIFFDPDWVDRLAGRFCLHYFQSLRKPVCAAWRFAEERAGDGRSSILQNLMLGINAHINFDLSRGIHEILVEDGDAGDAELMARRKFDHDQMNNVLVRCNPKLQEVLAREFGGGMRLFSGLFGTFDELLTSTGLRYYRDRVWCNVLALLSAKGPEEYEKVRLRLEWESRQVAEFIADGSWLNNVVFRVDSFLRLRNIEGRFQPEEDGIIHATKRMDYRLQMPHH